MNVTLKKLNGEGSYSIPLRDIVFVENVPGGTQVTTYDLRKLKVQGHSEALLRAFRRMIEDGMGASDALFEGRNIAERNRAGGAVTGDVQEHDHHLGREAVYPAGQPAREMHA